MNEVSMDLAGVTSLSIVDGVGVYLESVISDSLYPITEFMPG